LAYFGYRYRFHNKCNRRSKLGYLGRRSRLVEILRRLHNNRHTEMPPPAGLVMPQIAELWLQFYVNLDQSRSTSQITFCWSPGCNLNGISSSSPNRSASDAGYIFLWYCIDLLSLDLPVSRLLAHHGVSQKKTFELRHSRALISSAK
jgi:hypothetical protein